MSRADLGPVEATADQPGRVGLGAPLRVRSYRYLFGGQVTSLLGDQLLVIALPFIVFGGGGGVVGLGTVLSAYGVARVVALPLGGWISDRIPRRAVMLGCDVVRCGLVLVLLVAVGQGPATLAVLAAALGLAEGVFLPASYAILPEVVPPQLLSRANALSSGAQNLALLVGPGLGGLLVAAVNPRLNLAIDAATFALSALTLVRVRRLAPSPAGEDAASGAGESFWRFLVGNRLLQVVALLTVISNLAYFGMLEVALPVLNVETLHTGPGGYGAALAGFGLGSFVGSFLIVMLEGAPRRGVVACAIGMAQGVLFAAVAAAAGLPVVVVLLTAAGLTNGVLNVFYLSRVQQRVPEAVLGRAMSVLMMAVFAVHPVSVAIAAALAHELGPRPVFLAAGISIVAGFVIGALTRTYRDL